MADKKKRPIGWLDMTADEIWRIILTEGHEGMKPFMPGWRQALMSIEDGLLKTLPSDPRCMWCYAPFRGVGAPLMRAIGKSQSQLNPNVCIDCESIVHKHAGGAEVELTILFADVRGSTTLAEKMAPAEFSKLVDRFYRTTTRELIQESALIEKLIGDEVTAFFVPGLAGKNHARGALAAAESILLATGHSGSEGPWVPVGIGVHTGVAYVGAVGESEGVTSLAVLGDVPNTGSRLASAAKTGEIVFSQESARNAGIDTQNLITKELELKGKQALFRAYVKTIGPTN